MKELLGSLSEGAWAAVGAFITVVLAYIIKVLWLPKTVSVDYQTALRKELMENDSRLRKLIKTLEGNLEESNNRYYKLREDYSTLKIEYGELHEKYENAIERLAVYEAGPKNSTIKQ